MGPKQGPGICQGFNDEAFTDFEEWLSIFVDDFHIGSMTFEEHIQFLKLLLERGRYHGVQWRITKCSSCQSKAHLIGFEVSAAGRSPDTNKVKALHDWPEPAGLNDIHSMFAFANYLREFIPRFEEITAPLKPYRSKNGSWEAYLKDQKAQESVRRLRTAVATQCPLKKSRF